MIHTSQYKPRVYPYNGDTVPVEIDRVQELSAGLTINREKVKEVGRDGIVGWIERTPSLRATLRQYEYGNIEFFRKLANLGDSVTAITLNDFKTSMVDIAGYKTDDDGTFLGTVHYPKLRVSSFSLNIGSPEAIIERSFELAGEDELIWLNANKYLIYSRQIAVGAGAITFTLNDPSPVADPDESGNDGYIYRVLRVRSGTTTELTYGTDYSFTPASTLSINDALVDDVYKIYYTAGSYITGESTFTNNDVDVDAITADSVDIYLETSNYLYKLQSATINVSFDRSDYKEIGNSEIVQRGIRNKTVTVTLGRLLESYTIEQVLRGVATTYGKVDARKFEDDISLKLKVYSDSTKSLFKYEYRLTGLSPTAMDAGVPVDDYVTRNATLECETLVISTVAS